MLTCLFPVARRVTTDTHLQTVTDDDSLAHSQRRERERVVNHDGASCGRCIKAATVVAEIKNMAGTLYSWKYHAFEGERLTYTMILLWNPVFCHSGGRSPHLFRLLKCIEAKVNVISTKLKLYIFKSYLTRKKWKYFISEIKPGLN